MPIGPWMTTEKVAKQFLYGLAFLIVAGLVLWHYQEALRGLVRRMPASSMVVGVLDRQQYPRVLDGVLVDELATSTMVAVMLDNAPEAWPHHGLHNAQMVWEIPVEGPRTRLMALYDIGYLEDDVTIGPVRSVRPYFLSVAQSYDATVLHVGGSPEALDMIAQGYVDSLNQFSRDDYYWRAKKRYAPHNVMTSGELIEKARVVYDFEVANFESLVYGDFEVEDVISPSYVFGELAVDWKYDDGQYTRYQKNNVFRDAEEDIRVSNVVIMFAPMSILDNKLRRGVVMVGEGDVEVYRGGEKIEGSWSRSSDDVTMRFLNEDGEEIVFERGTTWVSVLPAGWSVGSTASD